MTNTTVERKVRKVERSLGVNVTIVWEWQNLKSKRPSYLVCYDSELNKREFCQAFDVPSSYERTIHQFHEWVYRERAKQKFAEQKGLCAICGNPMKGTENTECDHIESRGAHGRSDLLSNLQVVHGEPCHRERHTKGKNGKT